jgi:hypothetical protein
MSGPLQPEASEHPMMSRTGDDDWTGALGGTGTEGRPLAAPDEPPAVLPDDPGAGARPAGAELLERWSLARYGVRSLGDDDVLSRQSHLESLADGSYVEELRGEAAGQPAPGRPVPAEPWAPYPPPAGSPVDVEFSRSWLRRRRP